MSCNSVTEEAFLAAHRLIAQHGDFEVTGSVDSARRYIAAITTLIPLLPQRQQLGGAAGESIAWSIKDLIEMRNIASNWLSAREQIVRSRTSHVRFCRYRS